ncbi:MAG: exodeoxyribonuclease VII small subunit [Alphaproteobacteria bacterium]|nr:exodeoxyribonuclease VII small subunit [Alphaproteobacteria bacterium]
MGTDGMDFETSLAQLEERVRRLEAGDVPLDEALQLFEEGVSLARSCHEHLDAAQSRVAALTQGPSGLQEEPLGEPEDPE